MASTKTKAQLSRDKRREKMRKDISSMQSKNAKQQLDLLKGINSKVLSERDRKIKKALMARQKDIIKGLKPPTLASTAAKFGLRSIPGIGTFIAMFSPKPAGAGSDIVPGQEYKSGGKVAKKRR
tara:strand:- start:47 stop:418 length:372 start_codon:yes stop_codon:yes gene_type:complete